MSYITCTHVATSDEITEIEPLDGNAREYLVRVILIDHIYWMIAEAKELAQVLFPNERKTQ